MVFGKRLRSSLVWLTLAATAAGFGAYGCSRTASDPNCNISTSALEKLTARADESEKLRADAEMYKQKAEARQKDYQEACVLNDKLNFLLRQKIEQVHAMSERMTIGASVLGRYASEMSSGTRRIEELNHKIFIYEQVLGKQGYDNPQDLLVHPDLKPTAFEREKSQHARDNAKATRELTEAELYKEELLTDRKRILIESQQLKSQIIDLKPYKAAYERLQQGQRTGYSNSP